MTYQDGESPWTAEMVERLRSLWKAGLSTLTIGQRLGMTKNAIVGKVKRIGLPPRQSPIIRDPNDPRRNKERRKRSDKVRLPMKKTPVPLTVPSTSVLLPFPLPPTFSAPVHWEPTETARPAPPLTKCQWPLWDRRMPSPPIFCAEPVVALGRSYCAKHCRTAYSNWAQVEAMYAAVAG